LQENYTYAEQQHVPLVGFAYEAYDARNACIAAVETTLRIESDLRDLATTYRGLGAPVLLFCCGNQVQWWSCRTKEPKQEDTFSIGEIETFFERHRQEFSPNSIYRAKTIGRLHRQQQLHFVDIGLMPLLEKEMGERVSGLIVRMIETLYQKLGKPQMTDKIGRWLFQSAFWFLAAKILKDKGVRGFCSLNLENVSEVLERVKCHYNAEEEPDCSTQYKKQAIESAAMILNDFARLSNLTMESLAYVYENALVTKKTRKVMGTHATPSYLVDYIVWQLAPWIEQIPPEKRVVLEPTCGHAPFLTSAARLLRELLGEYDPVKRHQYLKRRLIGIERDSFAREVARLSMTLADVPNPNGWQLQLADVYEGNGLSRAAAKSTILLCNPPFQNFKQEEKSRYHNLECDNKTGEVLARTLPYMPAGSVFGVILPRSFLSKSGNIIPLRKILIENFEIYEICVLPDKMFTWADHESAVILGRKRTSKRIRNKTRFVRVREKTLDLFKDCYSAPAEVIEQVRFMASDNYDLSIPELEEVWIFCQRFNRLSALVDEEKTGKGLEYKGKPKKGETYDIKKHLPPNAQTTSINRFKSAVQGYAKFDSKIKLTDIPKLYWMNLADEVIRRPGHGKETGLSQILINSAPVSRGPWRLKALIDKRGYPITSSFIAIRSKIEGWSLEVLWAILNSPLANAYIYCYGTKRLVGVKRVLGLPIPNISDDDLYHLDELVKDYFRTVSSKSGILQSHVDTKEAEKKILAVDAEVLRLYDLPPRLERQVLYLFDGWERRGVDFEFTRYFPKDFESFIPLHEYLSEEYQRSNVSFVSKWVEEVRSPQIIKAFEKAAEAFKED